MKIWMADNASLENYFGCLYQWCDCLHRPRPFFWWVLPPLGIDTELGARSNLVRLLSAFDWQNRCFDCQFVLSCYIGFCETLSPFLIRLKRSSENFSDDLFSSKPTYLHHSFGAGGSICSFQPHSFCGQTFSTPQRLVVLMVSTGQWQFGHSSATGGFQVA